MAPVEGGGYDVERDIAYGEGGPRRRLDVYRPRGASARPRPLIVYLYGGIWTNGAKEDPSSFALPQALAARGAVVVVPDYRLYPETEHPGFMEDAAAAAAWARRNAATLGSDPRLVFLSGHSSGAHMALLIGLDSRYLQAAGFGAPPPAGLIGVSGVYEPGMFRLPIVRPAFRRVSDLRELLPVSYLRRDMPPVLLLTGSWDWMVDPGNSRRLAEAIRGAGGRVEVAVYPGIGHFDILTAGPWLPSLSPTADDVAAFVRARTEEVLGGR
jgi:acetyl esterase/lipase